MHAILDKIEGKLKLPIDIWFFFLFLLTWTLTVRKVLFYFPIKGTFNEYTGIYVYISDIFLIFTIGSWFLCILSHKFNLLSICRKWINWGMHDLSTGLPLLLVLLSFISLLWSPNQDIALFRSIKLLEYYLLYLYIIYRLFPYLLDVPRGTLPDNASKKANSSLWNTFKTFWQESVLDNFRGKCSTWNISSEQSERRILKPLMGWNIFFAILIFSGVFQSIIAIIQFITQKSLGLTFLRESILSPNLPGVAKIILNGEPYIRTYGLMPHPNILGGFLLFTIIVTILYYKIFHACPVDSECSTPAPWTKNVPRGTFLVFTGWNIIIFSYKFLIKKYLFNTKWPIKALISIQLIALLLTFSKSAILGFIMAVLYIFWKSRHSRLSSNAPDKNIFKSPSVSASTNAPHLPRGTFEPVGNSLANQDHSSLWKTLKTFWQESVLGNLRGKCSTPAPWTKNVPRGTFELFTGWNILRIFLSFHLNRTKLLIGLILAIVLYLIFHQLDFYYFIVQPIEERIFLLDVSRLSRETQMFHACPVDLECSTWNILSLYGVEYLRHLFLGSGIGQFVPSLSLFGQNLLLPWQYQPIHNIYLLIYAELGIIGLGLFIWFLWHIFHGETQNVPRGTFSVSERSRDSSCLAGKRATAPDFSQNDTTANFTADNVPRGTLRDNASKKANSSPWNTFKTFWQESVLGNLRGKCSTWNILRIYGVEHFENLRGGTSNFEINCHPEQNEESKDSSTPLRSAQNDKAGDFYSILCNNVIYLSSIYLKAILLGFLFIMLFDHYFWDIQQGSLMLWLILGLIVGLSGIRYNIHENKSLHNKND